MPDDHDRRELFDLLEAGLGTRGAGLLMAYLPPVGWNELATKSDLAALRSELRGEMAELRGEMAGLVPRLYIANLAGMIGVAALVLAAAHFA